MRLDLREPNVRFRSGSQSARDVTEAWVAKWMFCVSCGNNKINQFPPNLPVADFFCPKCNDQFELKSQKRPFGRKITNGAYQAKIERLESDSSPHFILMQYNAELAKVCDVTLIPRRFFVPRIIERRKPLAPTAKRAGWVGSNIIIGEIPKSGRIPVIKDGQIREHKDVLEDWNRTKFLDRQKSDSRGWLVEVMRCVENLNTRVFKLDEVYQFEKRLHFLYPDNNHVKPKIRQQLQVLRDNGYLEFLGDGTYRIT